MSTREIKFRGYHHQDKVMVYDLNSLRLFHGQLLPDDYILMQYTGLKDKNGKEIYEGDIVQFYLENGEEPDIDLGEIFFDEKNSALGIKWEGSGSQFFSDIDLERLEVVGNIYENSELIKENEK